MPINKIRFQPVLPSPAFFERFGTVTQCESALEQAKWSNGFACSYCSGQSHSLIYGDDVKPWQCRATVRTDLSADRFTAIGTLPGDPPRESVPAQGFGHGTQAPVGVNYTAARRLIHKLMQITIERVADLVLGEPVGVDHVHFGGGSPEKAGRRAETKVPSNLYCKPAQKNTGLGMSGLSKKWRWWSGWQSALSPDA